MNSKVITVLVLLIVVAAGISISDRIEKASQTATTTSSSTRNTSFDGTVHTDDALGISIAYPDYFSPTLGAPEGRVGFWSELASPEDVGTTSITLLLPKSYVPESNFSDARVTVGASSDVEAVETCLDAQYPSTASTSVMIYGTLFVLIDSSDAGAGNFYDVKSYRAVRDGRCYAIETIVHSTNIGNYEPGTVVEFDETRVKRALDGVVASFRFI